MSGYGAEAGPWAVAHRGGAGLAAENTMEAFARSYALGVRYLETDLRVTADGRCVAFHDATLDRVTDGSGPIRRRSWADVARLRVGESGRVPLLADLLDAFPDAHFAVDVKDWRVIGPLATVLRDRGAAERVCVAGAWDSWLAELRDRVGPGLVSALGWRSLSTLVACARAGVRPPSGLVTGSFVHVPLRLWGLGVYSARLVELAHSLGVRVLVWTVDEPVLMRRVLDGGADGVITDRPDLLREVLLSRGRWPAMSPVERAWSP
ncbi:MAG TPA: glycerophosphodiester phosphodiesterase family protein [Actinomycetales bacterium]|nr:glycerophosphodiester phosphodiesterase family protein [Actinomycetales bacterium]